MQPRVRVSALALAIGGLPACDPADPVRAPNVSAARDGFAWPRPAATRSLTGEPTPEVWDRAALELPSLTHARVWPLAATEPRALIVGRLADQPTAIIVAIDRGVAVATLDPTCAGSIIAVEHDRVVCGTATLVRAFDADGRLQWQQAFAADSSHRVQDGELRSRDAAGWRAHRLADGTPQGEREVPPFAAAMRPVGRCGEAWIGASDDGRLAMSTSAKAAPRPGVMPEGPLETVHCGQAVWILIGARGGDGQRAAVAIDPATGDAVGPVVRGFEVGFDAGTWLATADGIATCDQRLRCAPAVGPPLGQAEPVQHGLRAMRGRAGTWWWFRPPGLGTPLAHTLAPRFASSLAIGERYVIAGANAQTPDAAGPTRFALPPGLRERPALSPAPAATALPMPDATTVDLPAPTAASTTWSLPVARRWAGLPTPVPGAPSLVAVATLEDAPSETAGASVVLLDLEARVARWQADAGCGPGTPIALAANATHVVCAAATHKAASVRATTLDGSAAWQARFRRVDEVTVVDEVVVVRDGPRWHVLDARTGDRRFSADSADGGRALVTLTANASGAVVLAIEGGQLVARLAAWPALTLWSTDLGGVPIDLGSLGGAAWIQFATGTIGLIEPTTGVTTLLGGLSHASVRAHGGSVWAIAEGPITRLDGFGADGGRTRSLEVTTPGRTIVATSAAPGAPLVIASGVSTAILRALDPTTGTAMRQIELPPGAPASPFVVPATPAMAAQLGAVRGGPLQITVAPLDGAANVDLVPDASGDVR